MKRALWIALNILFALMFLFSVIVQYNDPDPLLWMCIYGAAALACVLALRRTRSWLLPAAVALLALVWAATLAPHVGGVRPADMFAEFEMQDEAIELAREMFGLLIVAGWMLVLVIDGARQTKR
jgi:hypothetical protein